MNRRVLLGSAIGAFTYGSLLLACTLIGLVLEEDYATGWDLLAHTDQVPRWQLTLFPVTYNVLIFPMGYLADVIGQPWAFAVFVWIKVPLDGAALGWLITERLDSGRAARPRATPATPQIAPRR